MVLAWNITNFCGDEGLAIWNGARHDIGLCFQQVFLDIPVLGRFTISLFDTLILLNQPWCFSSFSCIFKLLFGPWRWASGAWKTPAVCHQPALSADCNIGPTTFGTNLCV